MQFNKRYRYLHLLSLSVYYVREEEEREKEVFEILFNRADKHKITLKRYTCCRACGRAEGSVSGEEH